MKSSRNSPNIADPVLDAPLQPALLLGAQAEGATGPDGGFAGPGPEAQLVLRALGLGGCPFHGQLLGRQAQGDLAETHGPAPRGPGCQRLGLALARAVRALTELARLVRAVGALAELTELAELAELGRLAGCQGQREAVICVAKLLQHLGHKAPAFLCQADAVCRCPVSVAPRPLRILLDQPVVQQAPVGVPAVPPVTPRPKAGVHLLLAVRLRPAADLIHGQEAFVLCALLGVPQSPKDGVASSAVLHLVEVRVT